MIMSDVLLGVATAHDNAGRASDWHVIEALLSYYLGCLFFFIG